MNVRKQLFILLVGVFLLTGVYSCECDSKNLIDDSAQDISEMPSLEVTVHDASTGNPLARRLEIVSDKECSIAGYITTDLEPGRTSSTPLSTINSTTHTLWFYGLLADTTFDYTIHLADKKAEILYTGSFKMEALPTWVPEPESVQIETGADQSTWIAVTVNTFNLSENFVHFVAVVDRKGRYRYFHLAEEYPVDTRQFLEGLVILSNGDFSWNNRSDIVTANLAGEEYLLFDVHLNNPHIETSHHQAYIFENKKPVAWVLFNLFGMGVECDLVTPTENTIADGVAMLDENGLETNRWTVFDAKEEIPPEDMNMCECESGYSQIDIFDFSHANSVWPMDNDKAFIISLRNLSRIVKVDAQTGEIYWQLGKGLDFTWVGDEVEKERWFSFQHDPHWLDNGHLLLFDNHISHDDPCGPSEWSRALELIVDEDAKTVSHFWEHRIPYAPANGNAERMANGNTLISGGVNKRIVEVTSAGEVLWILQYSSEMSNLSTGKTYPALWEYDD